MFAKRPKNCGGCHVAHRIYRLDKGRALCVHQGRKPLDQRGIVESAERSRSCSAHRDVFVGEGVFQNFFRIRRGMLAEQRG